MLDSYWITRSAVTHALAFVVLARERLVARLLAWRTRAIAALAITLVIAARAHPIALALAQKLLATWQLLVLLAAATSLLHDLATRVARAKMTAPNASVNATVERAIARVATRAHLL